MARGVHKTLWSTARSSQINSELSNNRAESQNAGLYCARFWKGKQGKETRKSALSVASPFIYPVETNIFVEQCGNQRKCKGMDGIRYKSITG